MSGTVPPDAQGRWRGPHGRGQRGPTRINKRPTLPPEEIPADEEIEENNMTPQKNPSGGSGGIGGPKSPPPAPKSPPPPNPPPSE